MQGLNGYPPSTAATHHQPAMQAHVRLALLLSLAAHGKNKRLSSVCLLMTQLDS